MAHSCTLIVLAAGEGTRMRSSLPKVLHPVLGTPLLGHVLREAHHLHPDQSVVVVGHRRDQVEKYLETAFADVATAIQDQQLGTGHAVRCALDAVEPVTDTVVVTAGDTPLLRGETLSKLVEAHHSSGAKATVLSAHLEDPTGYGRIVRDDAGQVEGIVEHKDATDAQRAVTEINSGVYVFDSSALISALDRISTDNAQGEEYLTDVLGILHRDGETVAAYCTEDADDIHGVNNRLQLAQVGRIMATRVNTQLMLAGVTITDPDTTWISPEVPVGVDTVIERNCAIYPGSKIGTGCVIGPDTTLQATAVDDGAKVLRSHCEQAQIGKDANVGPFTYLRPGTQLGTSAKAGAFVEIKNSQVGTGSKVPHLSYVGDGTIGEHSNIGAATVFVNYDGVAKHRTIVGDHVRIGSDTMLVAPLEIGDGAYTGAGSVITGDVPAGALALGRGRQRNIDGWVIANRPASPAAHAAEQAAGDQPSES